MTSTTDPSLRSWVPVDPESHFPIQNIPFGVFRPAPDEPPRVGTAIGEHVLDLAALEATGLFDGPALRGKMVFVQPALNAFMALGRSAWVEARETISKLLREDEPTLRDNAEWRNAALLPRDKVIMCLPARIGDYTDFYSSKEHATNVGSMFRPDNPLLPNWVHMPIAYHGRSSTVVVSGTDLHRPCGQTKADDADAPTFGPSRLVDFELEMGFFVGPATQIGRPIAIDRAEDHIFGIALVNDWSARDIQKWEYQPLGPFLAKNFGTSIAPWVVTLEALEPFRVAGPSQDPAPLPYLQSKGAATYDITLDVLLQGEKMDAPHRICRSNFKHLYWSMRQQLAHHTATGCSVNPGDMMASGTISGATPDSFGSMLELAWRGTRPIEFPGGEERKFIQDGDRITMTGYCQGDGYRVGLGEVTGRILPVIE